MFFSLTIAVSFLLFSLIHGDLEENERELGKVFQGKDVTSSCFSEMVPLAGLQKLGPHLWEPIVHLRHQ